MGKCFTEKENHIGSAVSEILLYRQIYIQIHRQTSHYFLLGLINCIPSAVHKIFETRPSVSDRGVSCPQRSCHPPAESSGPCPRCRRLSCCPSPWRWGATPPEIIKYVIKITFKISLRYYCMRFE